MMAGPKAQSTVPPHCPQDRNETGLALRKLRIYNFVLGNSLIGEINEDRTGVNRHFLMLFSLKADGSKTGYF